MTRINADIVSLINGIISHGNHTHEEYSEQDFEGMYDVVNSHGEGDEMPAVEDMELCELYETVENSDLSDFTVDFDGNEYRIIAESDIWDIYVDTIKELVNDCYDLKLDQVPDFVALEIDWEQTAKNAYVDGYGHTFSGYDGSESEAGGFWIFRTN